MKLVTSLYLSVWNYRYVSVINVCFRIFIEIYFPVNVLHCKNKFKLKRKFELKNKKVFFFSSYIVARLLSTSYMNSLVTTFTTKYNILILWRFPLNLCTRNSFWKFCHIYIFTFLFRVIFFVIFKLRCSYSLIIHTSSFFFIILQFFIHNLTALFTIEFK